MARPERAEDWAMSKKRGIDVVHEPKQSGTIPKFKREALNSQGLGL